MQNTFSKIVMASVAMAAIVVGTSAASAESTVKVPFAFKVGNKICPAGEYVVQNGFNHNLVSLSNREANVNFSWVSMPADPNGNSKATLSFDQVDGTPLLKTVQYGSQKSPIIDKGSKQLERSMHQNLQGQ
jgi:hypothetical protein